MASRRILRVLDANFNRLREGLRVVEEAERLVYDDARLARRLKLLRHEASACEALLPLKVRLRARDSENDVGRNIILGLEGKRTSLKALLGANFKRCQEAARVLEEFGKMADPRLSAGAKRIRFRLYDLEKYFASGA